MESLKLIKKNDNVVNGLRDEHIQTYPQRSGEAQQPTLWRRLVESVTTMDVLYPIESGVQRNFIQDDESKHVFDDVIEVSTIVKRIRRRNKRNIRPMNRSLNGIKKNITNRRSKRSSDDSKINDGSSTDVTEKSTPNTRKLYRHPKLTHEDRETREKDASKFSDIAKENNTNANEFAEFYKRIWDIINGTRPRFKIVVPSIKESRRRQAAISKDDRTARSSASEVDDLNLPYNKTSDKESLEKAVPFDEKRPSREDESEKYYVKAEVEGIEDRTDDPDGISFTEDYNYPSSESINEDTEKPRDDDRAADSPEEIDSSVENLNLHFNQTGSLYGHTKSSPIREPLNSVPGDTKKHATLLFKNETTIDEDQEIYDPDKIPYVEVPDYEDVREKSLDEEDRRQAEKKDVKLLNTGNSFDRVEAANADTSTNSEEGRKDDFGNVNLESYETITNENNKKEFENPDEMEDVNDIKKKENEGEETEKRPREEKESNEESVLSIIPFDINEYTKPFNLHDFLKDEPFFATLKKDKAYVRENSDRDEITEGGNYSTVFEDNISLDIADADEQDPRYEHVFQDHSIRDIYDTKNATGSEEIIGEDLYRYGGKDFFKQPFEENRKKRENLEMSAEEEDFLDRYFTEDVIKKLKEDSPEQELRETKKNEMIEKHKNKKDTLKSLISILERKDRISRLDEEANKRIEDGKNTPTVYKNYWSLEYDLPGKNEQSTNENKSAS